jgi:choline monooxygenase
MALTTAVRLPSERYSPDPNRALTLPARYYFDPAIYAREKEEIWFKTWQFVGFAADVANPGDFFAETVVDQPIFVIRTKQGELRAFYNVCMHRGHVLVEGRGNKTILTCPFHAWSYDTTGTLKAAGNAENVAGFRLADFSLAEIRVGVLANMVFVNLDAAAPPLEQYLTGFEADVRAKVPKFDQLKWARRDHYDCDFNWKFVMDQNECYHCPHIHPGVMAGEGAYLEPSFEITMFEHWDAVIAYSSPEKKSPYGAGQGDEIENVYIWTVFPNLIISTHQGPSNFKVQRVVPNGPETAWSTVDNLCVNDPPTAMDIKQFNYFRDRVWPEDSPCMTKQQRGMKSLGYRQGRLMVDAERSWRSEHAVHHFDMQVWEALNGKNYG